MFHKIMNNDKTYWINPEYITFIVEVPGDEKYKRIIVYFTSGEHINIEDSSKYQELLKYIERRK